MSRGGRARALLLNNESGQGGLTMETYPDLGAGAEFLRGYLELEPDNKDLIFPIDKLQRVINLEIAHAG
jgi:hypothetical protein